MNPRSERPRWTATMEAQANQHQQELSLRRRGAATRNRAVCSWCEEEVEGTLDGLCQACNKVSREGTPSEVGRIAERAQEQREARDESRGKL